MESRLFFEHFLPCANSAPHDAPRPGRRSRGTPNMERADGSWLYMQYSYRKTNENQWINVRSQLDLMIPKRPASWCPGRSVAFVRLSVPYLGSIFLMSKYETGPNTFFRQTSQKDWRRETSSFINPPFIHKICFAPDRPPLGPLCYSCLSCSWWLSCKGLE